MAKHYVTVTVLGCSLDSVTSALTAALGPILELWRGTHLLGVHIDVSDVTDAVAYGDRFESAGTASGQVAGPVVDVDLYARSDSHLQPLQLALAEALAHQLSVTLGVPTKVEVGESQ